MCKGITDGSCISTTKEMEEFKLTLLIEEEKNEKYLLPTIIEVLLKFLDLNRYIL